MSYLSYNDLYADVPTVAPSVSGDSTGSKDSGYESAPSSTEFADEMWHIEYPDYAALSASLGDYTPVNGKTRIKYIYRSIFVITSNHVTDS